MSIAGLSRHNAVVTDQDGDWREKVRDGLVKWLDFWGLRDQSHAAEEQLFNQWQRRSGQPEPDALTEHQRMLAALERYYMAQYPRRKFQERFESFRLCCYPDVSLLSESHCLSWVAFAAGLYSFRGSEIVIEREMVADELDAVARIMEAAPETVIELPDVKMIVTRAAARQIPKKAKVS